MKRRVVKKQMKRVLDSELPTMFKLSAMHELIKASQKSSWFQFKDFPYVRFDRFSTTLHKGVITVSEHDKVDELGFSLWRQAITWICKQAKLNTEYVLDSGHFRYRVFFPKTL